MTLEQMLATPSVVAALVVVAVVVFVVAFLLGRRRGFQDVQDGVDPNDPSLFGAAKNASLFGPRVPVQSTERQLVAVMPEAEEVEFELDPKDLRIDTFRSSGAGGQHINKTSSAIRVTHLPTGMVVECQDERSQYKNKDKALKVLRSRLLAQKQAEQDAQLAAQRKSQVGTGDRSERIRTYNYPQGRVTDHRIGLTLYKIDAIMDGGLDELIDALVMADQAERLRQGQEA